MRDRWYGDNHDLVKWAALIKLASLYRARGILQVAYYRPETIDIDGCKYPIPEAVISHFSRDLKGITRLNSPEVQIHVVNSEWTMEGRATGAYLKEVQAVLEQLPTDSPCLIFLDPDTGLEPPNSNPQLEHILESELQQVWRGLIKAGKYPRRPGP